MKKQQVMVLNSKKKHSVRYDAEDKNDAVIASVYIMNTAFEPQSGIVMPPPKITITVESE